MRYDEIVVESGQQTADRVWYHGTDQQSVQFAPDRPVFFAAAYRDAASFAGDNGFIVSARLTCKQPINEDDLLKVGVKLGLIRDAGDLFSADYDDFPDVSSFLSHAKVRRYLEQLGYDAYWGTDGYFEAVVVWHPNLIQIDDISPVGPSETASATPSTGR